MDNAQFQQHAGKIEQLVERVSAIADEGARSTALELMQALMDLHGEALTRTVELLSASGEAGRSSLAQLGGDPLICGLLVLYGIHPVPMEERVAAAIEKVLPQLRKQGGSVELLGVNADVVRVMIQASGNGCHSSPDALRGMVEQSIREAAPEILEIVDEGDTNKAGFIPLHAIQPIISEGKSYEKSAA